MPKKECLAMLLAGGQGSRLGSLTRRIAKPALSFGGKYRIIDFSLSNCANSNIDTVGVLTQYKPFSLNSYIGVGSAWDLDSSLGGVHILPPYVREEGGSWYKGTANAIYQNMEFIGIYHPEYVIVLSGDHIYKMNYSLMLKFHKEKKAEATIAVIQVPWEEASRFGVMQTDETGRILEFAEKPSLPRSNLASMGVYIFNWPVLRQALTEDELNPGSSNDFGKDVIPMLLKQGKRLYAYLFQGYWKDVGTIDSYYQANMELLEENPPFKIFDADFRIYSNEDVFPPHYVGPKAKINNSLVSNGSTILGNVVNSVLSPGVFIGEGARIENSILLSNVVIQKNAWVRRTIVGENAEIKENCIVGINTGGDFQQAGITVIEDNSVLPAGSLVKAGEQDPRKFYVTG
ncbi:MAG: glucose-1-phosphate adenylyltransferase [Syntrophomonadaceae bacterium]|nr:glucose-1-phosphate adenylyltransferase [Syntrophomonadaceae bacterium]